MFGKAIVRGLLAMAMVACCAVVAQAVIIDLVPVGDAGNAADTAAHSGNSAGQGAVPYNYSIGKYDVTNDQYAAFLNAKASNSDPYGLWNTSMGIGGVNAEGGINRAGSGPYIYSVKLGQGNQPVVPVTWFDTLRFANWLNNGQGTLASTETGSYTLLGGTPTPSNAATISRNPVAQWVLPNEDEWYKAAYYKSGGANAGYWTYPTRSDAAPTWGPPTGGTNSANFFDNTTGFALTHSTIYDSTKDYLTDVGAYSSSLSPYGTLDQGGDVWQWNEADILGDGSSRGIRDGSWGDYSSNLASSSRHGINPSNPAEDYCVGFRVAYVPEPCSLIMLISATIATLIWWRRRK